MIYGGAAMGSPIGCGAGAFVVCILSNGYARWKKCSSVVIKVPCIMVLVPGSVGFNAMATILASKPAEQRSEAEQQELFEWWLATLDKPYGETVALGHGHQRGGADGSRNRQKRLEYLERVFRRRTD